MKQHKTQEVRLTRADLIAYIAERDRQVKSKSAIKTAATNTRNPDGMRYCFVGG